MPFWMFFLYQGKMPGEAIRKALGDIDVRLSGDELPAGALARDESTDLGWSLMLIVLALVAGECFMAMRFGHYRRETHRHEGT